MRSTPRPASSLRSAVAQLPSAVNIAAAAMQLALPCGAFVGVDAVITPAGNWLYRGFTSRAGQDPYREAASLSALGHRIGDRYLDLDLDSGPADWVTVADVDGVRVAAGLPALFGQARIVLAGGLPDQAAADIAAGVLAGTINNPPCLCAAAGRAVLVDVAGADWVAHPA